MHVLVTGGAGFIGANLCRHLSSARQVRAVTVVDDLSTGSRANLADCNVRFIEGSILDSDLLASVCREVDTIVHLAARPSVPRSLEDPVATHTANATGTVRVLEAARAAGAHVIVASSSSVYGANPTLPKHERLAPEPLSPYAASKLAAESYALSYARSFGLDVLALRFFNVFGPLQGAGHAYAAVIPVFIDAALRREPFPVHGDGQQTRDFTYVGTVCSVLSDAVVRRVTSSGPVNLAFGTRTSLLELIELLREVIGTDVDIKFGPARQGDVRNSQADQSVLRALFPDVDPIPLVDGLGSTVKWFRALTAAG